MPLICRFLLIIAVLLAIAAGVIFLKLHNPLARPAPNNTRQVSIITASADTYVDSGMPSANFGKQEMFEVKGGVPESKALLHFDLKDLPAGAVIHSAMLELTPAQDLTSAGGYVMEVKGKWAENRVNANNAPLAGAIIATIPNPTRPGSPQSVEVTSSISIATNVWYHLAGVRTATAIQLYVNGQLQGQSTANFAQDYGNFPLYFGTTGQTVWDGKLAGQLDEVSLFNRPLSAVEISAIYAAGAAGKCFSIMLPIFYLGAVQRLSGLQEFGRMWGRSHRGPYDCGKLKNLAAPVEPSAVLPTGPPATEASFRDW